MKRLIVNADDFGLHPLINEGILESHQKGIVTSTSLLASGEAFDDAIMLAKETETLGVGIHICLVGGLAPVCDPNEVSSLLVNGKFPETHTEFMKRLFTGKINGQELRKEIEAQFNKIMSTGVPITHIDGHQHMHVLPQVLPIVAEQMKRYGINKIRMPDESPFLCNGVRSIGRWIGKVGLTTLTQQAYATSRDLGFSSPLYFWGMMNGGQLHEDALLGILSKVSNKHGVHEIMTHPGKGNRTLNVLYPWGYHWDEERWAMTSSRVKEYLSANEISLIHYGQWNEGDRP